MGYHFQKSHAISARKQEIIREIAHHNQPTPALDHNHYRWDSALTKPRRIHQTPTSLTQIGYFLTHAQPSVPQETIILSKNPTR